MSPVSAVTYVPIRTQIDPPTAANSYGRQRTLGFLSYGTIAVIRFAISALTPGMPVEVPTGLRTILSYLVKPLGDQIERAFREE